jgi:hypothetical protein
MAEEASNPPSSHLRKCAECGTEYEATDFLEDPACPNCGYCANQESATDPAKRLTSLREQAEARRKAQSERERQQENRASQDRELRQQIETAFKTVLACPRDQNESAQKFSAERLLEWARRWVQLGHVLQECDARLRNQIGRSLSTTALQAAQRKYGNACTVRVFPSEEGIRESGSVRVYKIMSIISSLFIMAYVA